jgi:D-xylose transport system substrate-binding protein
MKLLQTALLASVLAVLCSPAAMADAKNPKIGFSIDDLRLERWARDRDYFTAAAEKLGAKVYVQSADANEQRQISQIENLISRGVDVIVIVPFNATVLNNVIAEAKKAKVKVVSYDRLILNADIDAYISFDNEKVGEMQAQGVLNAQPKGNYFLLGGAIQALNAQKLAGKVPVSGQDADLAAIKRVIAGTQTMTVYKPLQLIASEAAKLSVQLVRDEQPAYNSEYDNGTKTKIKTILLKPTELTKANVKLLVDDKFYTQAQIDGQ